MSGFAYFLPGYAKQILPPEDLPAELVPVLEGATWSNAPLAIGPTGGGGLRILPECPFGTQADYTVPADRWSWVPAILAEDQVPAYWLGWITDQPPKPVDLWRGLDVGGHPVQFGDGHFWQIPAIHAPRTELPQTFTFEAGTWRTKPLPKYADVMQHAAKWVDRVYGRADFDDGDWCRFACDVLGVLYRVGPLEISALGLLRTSADLMFGVIGAALDLPAIAAELEAQKKTVTPAAG